MSDTSVSTLIMNRLVDSITTQMISAVSDDTALGLARSGRLQANPLIGKLNLLVREGGEAWPDILIPPNYPFYAPQYEMPFGESWLRRYIAQYEMFFFGQTRIAARENAHVVFSRFKHLVGTLSMVGLTDTFGETAVMAHSTKLKMVEEGGPATNFIWRGIHYVEVVTSQAFE